jgi:hypothetical protein
MVLIDKDYVFAGTNGEASLLDLFDGRRQLILYHFMYAPGVEGWPSAGCPGCSMFVDSIGELAHLHARDTSFALVSIAPSTNIEPYKERMGWTVPWVSSHGNEGVGALNRCDQASCRQLGAQPLESGCGRCGHDGDGLHLAAAHVIRTESHRRGDRAAADQHLDQLQTVAGQVNDRVHTVGVDRHERLGHLTCIASKFGVAGLTKTAALEFAN